MCLGIPARVLAVGVRHPDLASVDMGGVRRDVNIGLLDGPDVPAPGDWVLVHMGFALERMTEQQADEAIQALSAEQDAEARYHQEESR